jgi:hypothetical protein
MVLLVVGFLYFICWFVKSILMFHKILISFKKGRLAWFGVLRGFLSQVIRLMIINLLRIEKKNILLKK